MDEPVQNTDMPVEEPQAPVDTPTESPPPAQEAPAEVVETPPVEEEEAYTPPPPVPATPPIDFSNLPVDENNLIDPNALASQINQRIAQAEQNASMRAQQIYAEQETEKRQWDKAFEKYPDLKSNKDLQNLVHQARLGEVTDILSRSNNSTDLKLPTPSQVADKLFKHIGTAKTDGFNQATTNTVVQKSATLETASRRSNDSGDEVSQARSNLNNPNKQVANKARSFLLERYLTGGQ